MARGSSTTAATPKSLSESRSRRPPLYRVLMHNDDYTTMEFVVAMLQGIFHKPLEEATRVMLQIHRKGHGVCGLYPFEIAETKIDRVHRQARESGFPLRCSMEPE